MSEQPEPDSDGMEYARITITRVLDDDGTDTVQVETSDGLTMLEALGMLRLTEDTLIVTRMLTHNPDEPTE